MTTPEALPTAIFVPTRGEFMIYRGSPDEMVASMAATLGADTIEEAIHGLVLNIALHRHVFIRLPEDMNVDEKALAAHFVKALLASKIALPMAQA